MPIPAIPQPTLTLAPAPSCTERSRWRSRPAGQDTRTLGSRIARLRREKGLTQVEFAERLGVTQPAVSDYENDDIRVPADVVVQIATILGVSTMSCSGSRRSPQSRPPAPRTADSIDVCRISRSFPVATSRLCCARSRRFSRRRAERGRPAANPVRPVEHITRAILVLRGQRVILDASSPRSTA